MPLNAPVLLAAASPDIAPTALECLRLRALAPALLFGAPEPDPATRLDDALACSPTGWHVFLHSERCAIAWQQALQQRGWLERLAPAARDLLARAAQAELQRNLAARAQLLELAALATELQTPTIVLKGALAAARGMLVDVGDIDVLLSSEADARRFAAELDRRGYSAGEYPESAQHQHHAPRARPGALLVEVHRHLRVFTPDLLAGALARARPLEALPGLLCLAPADHLWHVLLHAVVQHPERRNALRDQLLIRAAWAECAPGEREVVLGRIREQGQAALLRSALEAALASGEAEDAARPGAGLQFTAARYAVAAAILRLSSPPPSWLSRPLKELTLTLAVDRAQYARFWRELALPAPNVARRVVPGGRWPKAGQALLAVLRTLRLLALTPAAALLVWQGKRAARGFHALIDTARGAEKS